MPPVWILDTSSIAEVRRSIENTRKQNIFRKMADLVTSGRLMFPKQVSDELERFADPDAPDAQAIWAKENLERASQQAANLEEIKEVLSVVPRVLDPEKDSGTEEADPYVLALAVRLRSRGVDARIITQDRRDIPKKMSLSTAAGLMGVPSVPLMAFLEFEKIS